MIWKNLELAVIFLWFMAGGITHFTNTAFYVAIVPPYLGYQLDLVCIGWWTRQP